MQNSANLADSLIWKTLILTYMLNSAILAENEL
jgi:hypothetical protein